MVLIMVGIGLWPSPELYREGFLARWSLAVDEIGRLIDDPFAVFRIEEVAKRKAEPPALFQS